MAQVADVVASFSLLHLLRKSNKQIMKYLKILKSQKGFTLVELITVTSITGLLLVLVSTIFVQIIQSNTRATVANDIREQGQFIIENVVRAVRSAESVSAPGGVTTGKVLQITVTSAGVSDTYLLTCIGTNPSITKNGQQLNTTKILTSVNCDGSIDQAKSYFEMIPPVAGAPPAVRINLVLETTGTLIHREYIGKQTLTQLVTLRTYAK